MLGCGKDKVIKLKKDLVRYGLIDEVRQGVTKANRIYVKNIITDINILNMDFDEAKTLVNAVKSAEVEKHDFKKSRSETGKNRPNRLYLQNVDPTTQITEFYNENDQLLKRVDYFGNILYKVLLQSFK